MKEIIALGLNAFRLLPLRFQKAAGIHLLWLVLQSGLEIISVAALVPLLYQAVPGQTRLSGSSWLNAVSRLSDSLPWYTLLGIIVLVFMIKNITSLWLAHGQSVFVRHVAVYFTRKLYHRFFRQGWTAYLRSNSAENARRILNSPADFANYIVQGFLLVLTDLFVCLLMLAAMAIVDYRVVVIVCFLAGLMLLFSILFRKHIFSSTDLTFRKKTSQANIILAQGIDSFAEARIYRKEEFFLAHFINFREATAGYLARLKTMMGVPPRIFEVVGILCLVMGIGYAHLYPAQAGSPVVVLGLISLAIYRIMPSLNRMLVNLMQVQAFRYSVEELRESFREEHQKTLGQTPIPFETSIRLANLSFRYDETPHPIFRNLNLTIRKGDFLVITGRSGAGKTTLIHLLAGLMNKYDGTIMIDDIPLSENNILAWQQKIGFVPQSPVVLQDSLKNNVAFGEENVDHNRLVRALRIALLEDFIDPPGNKINTPIGENGLNLSGGQRQRLVLARALYRDPTLLLLDEVTNQLDETTKVRLLENLKELTRLGLTVIFASHDPVVMKYATASFQVGGGN